MASLWIVTDGKAGMESQCLGLAEALGLEPIIKRARLRSPWKELSPYLRLGHRYAFTEASDRFAPPWPDLLIASGRQSIAASLYVREESRKSGPPTVTVQIQNPAISPAFFDLVIAPAHDCLRGANVVSTLGALHRIRPAVLAEAAARFAPRFAHLPRPYIAVSLGGPNGVYRFDTEEAGRLGAALAALAHETGGSLLVTPSRRTGEANLAALRAAVAKVPAFIWDGAGENPYFALLGLADRIVVTGDSVNMVTEAVASGKPVQVFDLPGGSNKTRRFHDAMRARGLTQSFPGALVPHPVDPSTDDMAQAAAAVRRIYAAVRGVPLAS